MHIKSSNSSNKHLSQFDIDFEQAWQDLVAESKKNPTLQTHSPSIRVEELLHLVQTGASPSNVQEVQSVISSEQVLEQSPSSGLKYEPASVPDLQKYSLSNTP